MNTFDKNKHINELEEILKHFNKITGLRMTVFDTHKNVLAEYPKSHCSFCNFVNNNCHGKELCEKSNWDAFEICKKNKKVHIYKCHMGLLEVVLPLVEHDKIIGFVMFGQIINSKDRSEIYERLTNNPNILYDNANVNDIIDSISEIKYHSSNLIHAEIQILQLCCTVILSKQMVPYEKTLYDNIIDYIHSSDLRTLKISDMCKNFGVSRTLIYTAFAEHESIGIAKYIRDIKIKKAIQLLKEGQLSIKEIAYETGFNDSNHFIKVFKNHSGLTPKEFKIQNNN